MSVNLDKSLDDIIDSKRGGRRAGGGGGPRGRYTEKPRMRPYRGGGGGGRNIIVGNLSWDVQWQELKDAFRNCAEVVRADVFAERRGRSKGIGIVELASAADARKAIQQMDGTSIMGREVWVREDRDEGGRTGGGGGGGGGKGARMGRGGGGQGLNVVVGNLPWGTSWQDLKDHMRQEGEVVFAEILGSSGTGIVQYDHPAAAKRAIRNLHDTELGGRPMWVREDREE